MALTPEQKRRQRQRQRARARRERQQARLNPLNAPFKTPAQLRAEAQRMAELSVTPEATLREEQRKEEEGLGAISGTAAGVLGGYQQQVLGGLQGLGQLYSGLAGSARTAGEEAVAAAGAAPSIAPTGTATVPAEFANVAAGTSGYVPAAVTTGQRLIGTSRSNLSRALAERSSALSQNMAKFLQDLQQQEYEKAIAQEASAQNAARLGLAEREYETDVAFRSAELDLKRQGLALEGQKILAGIEKEAIKAAAKVTGEKNKKRTKIKSTQDQILAGLDDLFVPAEYPTNRTKYKVNYVIPSTGYDQAKTGSVEIEATSLQNAQDVFAETYPGFAFANATSLGLVTEYRRPNTNEVRLSLVKSLIKAGMSRKAAERWVTRRVNLTGAFQGGVGSG